MNILSLINLNLNYNIGFFIAMIVPFFFLLLIARFRSFLASIFFFPFLIGSSAFALTFEQVTNLIKKLGTIGEGLLDGITVHTTYFEAFHLQIIEFSLQYLKNETIANIFRSDWFMCVPYFLFFIVFFALFKKRRREKEEDYI